jgi:HEAT repeat protein
MLWLIRRQLRSKNTAFRRKAAEQLCGSPNANALGALSEALKDEDADVRRLAATALSKIEDEARIEPLLVAIRDHDADVQVAAITGLRKILDGRIPPALVPLLRHPHAGVRACAAQVLESAGWHPATREDEIWLLVAKGECSRAASFGKAALIPLETVVNSGSYSLCVSAVRALGEIADQRAVRPLLRALTSSDGAVCAAAVTALAQAGGPEVIEPITGMLQHKHGHVRLAAVEALGSLGAARAVESLRALAQDPQWDVRRAVAETLGRLKDKRGVEALTQGLKDSDEDVREAAALALGTLGERSAIGPLVLALKDLGSGVRRIAAAALSRIDENWSSSVEARAAAEVLKASLYDPNPAVRYIVGQILVGLGAMDPETHAMAESGDVSVASIEKRRKLAVNLFLAILGDTDPDLRQAAAEALGRLGQRRAEPGLVRALRDADANVRLAAERALEAIAVARMPA